MNIYDVFINIGFSLLLFFINATFGKFKLKSKEIFAYSTFGFGDCPEENFSGNFAQMIIHPPIYIAIITGILQLFSYNDMAKNLWLVVPFYWIIRFLSISWKNLFAFINWKVQVLTCAFSITLSELTLLFVIRLFIEKNVDIFISLEELKNAFWFAIIAYIAKLIWDVSKYKMIGENIFSSKTKDIVIMRRYNKFYNRYHELVDKTIDIECTFKSEHYKAHFKCLLYAIMIYEDHNRSPWIRLFEYLFKMFFWKRTFSLGIMQVQSNVFISSKTSIIYAIRKLYPVFSESESSDKLYNAISEYNIGTNYFSEVTSIYEKLKDNLQLKAIDVYPVIGLKRRKSKSGKKFR